MTNQRANHPIKWTTWLKAIVLITLVILVIGGTRWVTYTRQPLPEALEALKSDSMVQVVQKPWLVFRPVQTEVSVGFIFYPGGRIDPRSYAPLMHEIASAGYLVVVPKMPFNIAAFHPNSADLSDYNLPAALIYGSLDPRANQESVMQRQHLLPETIQYIRIEGGDHHQFGSYHINPEDHHATIVRASQHEQIIQATLELLNSISHGNLQLLRRLAWIQLQPLSLR
jgi:hypothetical protein